MFTRSHSIPAVWPRTNRRRDLARLRELARERDVRRIIVGLPVHLDGSASDMSEKARAFARRLEKTLGLPVEMVDERLSSWEAGRIAAKDRAHTRGKVNSSNGRTTPVDDIAAAVILRDYLERAQSSTGATP